MSPALQRQIFPLCGPRRLTLAWWPVHALCAAVAGYHEAFFAVLRPAGR